MESLGRFGSAAASTALTLALALPVRADSTSPASAEPPAAEAPAAAVLAYYPAAARAAGVNGKMSIVCHRSEQALPVDCAVTSETPAGQGFGAAALAIAANAHPLLDKPLSQDEMAIAIPFRFQFKAAPSSITPDLLHVSHSSPHWLRRPSGDAMAAAYPQGAIGRGVDARVTLQCRVAANGEMRACAVTSETPSGAGFGEASLKIAPYFLLSTFTDDGRPTVDAAMTIPMHWVPFGG